MQNGHNRTVTGDINGQLIRAVTQSRVRAVVEELANIFQAPYRGGKVERGVSQEARCVGVRLVGK